MRGWTPRPRRKRWPSSRASIRAPVIPVNYIDYSTLKVVRGDLLGNAVASDEFDWKLQLSRLPQPVDRVAVVHDPADEQCLLRSGDQPDHLPGGDPPAALLRSQRRPGGQLRRIGATIGHEIGHGFDDQGRQYDATGKLRDWWTPAAAKAYESRTAMLVKQYDGYEPLPGTRIKGELTLGENIGDLGGLEMAYAAYRRYVAQHGEPPVIDGLTGDQRFFLAYGQSGKRKTREGALRQQLLTDPHSPRATGSTASSATSTPGTRRSTSSPATSCICRPSSASASGRQGAAREAQAVRSATFCRKVSLSNGLRSTGVSGQAAATASLSE